MITTKIATAAQWRIEICQSAINHNERRG